MTFDFYKINTKSNTVNKLLNKTPVKTKNIPLNIQKISRDGFSIQFSEFIDANFVKFSLGSETYVCTVIFEGAGNNLFNYTFKIDSITTAYENDCLKCNNLVVRSQDSTVRTVDDSQPIDSTDTVDIIEVDDVPTSYGIVLNVIDTTPLSSGSVGQVQTSHLMVKSYAFLSENDFATFFLVKFWDLTDKQQSAYGQSVLSIYAIDRSLLTEFVGLSVNSMTLSKVESSTLRWDGTAEPNFITFTRSPNDPYFYDFKDYTSKTQRFYNVYTDNLNYDIPNYMLNASCTLRIRKSGTINFTPAMLGINKITSIGYSVALDPVSGRLNFRLFVNGNRYDEYSLLSEIPDQLPFIFDNSIVDWNSKITNSALSIALSSAALIGSVALAPETGGMSLAAGIGVASSVGSAVADITNTAYNSQFGTNAYTGTAGGSPDNISHTPTQLIIRYREPISEVNFQATYGKPDRRVRYLHNLYGFFKTANCKLLLNGLPPEIVNEAERVIDDGVYMT